MEGRGLGFRDVSAVIEVVHHNVLVGKHGQVA